MKKASIRLSLSGFLFEDNSRKQSLTFKNFAILAREAGYTGVELRKTQISLDTPADTIAQYRTILDDNDLSVTCMTPRGLPTPTEERNEYFKRYLELAGKMRCPLLKISGGAVKDIDWLSRAVETAASYEIDLAINTHVNSPTETVSGALELANSINSSHFGLLYDCMHLCIANEDYLNAIETLYPHICGLLVQCLRPSANGEKPVIQHAGKDYSKTCIDQTPIQDWSAVISKFKSLGYNGWITVIENSWPVDQQKDIAIRTAKQLQKLWQEE